MHKHELSVLSALKEKKRMSFAELLEASGLGKDEAMWAISNLEPQKLIEVRKEGRYEAKISREGEEYAKTSLPEILLVRKIREKKVALKDLTGKEDQIGIIWAKRKGLVEASGGELALTAQGRKAEKEGTDADLVLKEIYREGGGYPKHAGVEALKELEQRKLIVVRGKEEIREVEITQRGVLALAQERQAEQMIDSLDRSMITSRSWSGKKFKPYDAAAQVAPMFASSRHRVRSIINELRSAYIGLGFTEVSGPIIEPAFWVFDYLFVPQDHPARDVQDTFFLSRPRELPVHDRSLEERIKREHEKAWHDDWSGEIARRAILRTHTTSVTGRNIHAMVSALAEKRRDLSPPIKLFTVGRVFRNENLDYKHLADFYMTDGIVIGRNLTLANLFGILLKVYNSMGVKIRFKPAYFPFVEPGAEVHVLQDGKWLELGGAGIIRREITGVSRKSISVLAWGLGVERIALLKDSSIDSIVSMYNSSAGWLRERRV